MKLSSDYRRVVSLFNTPLEGEIEYEEMSEMVRAEFQAGPFLYAVEFQPESRSRTTVAFALIDIDATDEEIIEIVSRSMKKPVSLEEAREAERHMLRYHAFDALGIGGT